MSGFVDKRATIPVTYNIDINIIIIYKRHNNNNSSLKVNLR